MPSVGPTYINLAVAETSLPAAGQVTWANPTNAQGSTQANYATATIGASGTQYSRYLRLSVTSNTLAIPAGATITGVEAIIERSQSGSQQTKDYSVRLYVGSSYVGNDLALGTVWQTADTAISYGGDGIMWGLTTSTLTPDALNGEWGVGFAAYNTSGTNTFARVDTAQLRVFYTEGGFVYSATVTLDATSNSTGAGVVTIAAPAVALSGAADQVGNGVVSIAAPAVALSGAADLAGNGGLRISAASVALSGAANQTGNGVLRTSVPAVAMSGASDFLRNRLTNLAPNPGVNPGLSPISANTGQAPAPTVTRDTTQGWESGDSVRVVTNGTQNSGAGMLAVGGAQPAGTYTVSCYVKTDSTAYLGIAIREGDASTGAFITENWSAPVSVGTSWTRISLTRTISVSRQLTLKVGLQSPGGAVQPNPTNFNADAFMIHSGSEVLPFFYSNEPAAGTLTVRGVGTDLSGASDVVGSGRLRFNVPAALSGASEFSGFGTLRAYVHVPSPLSGIVTEQSVAVLDLTGEEVLQAAPLGYATSWPSLTDDPLPATKSKWGSSGTTTTDPYWDIVDDTSSPTGKALYFNDVPAAVHTDPFVREIVANSITTLNYGVQPGELVTLRFYMKMNSAAFAQHIHARGNATGAMTMWWRRGTTYYLARARPLVANEWYQVIIQRTMESDVNAFFFRLYPTQDAAAGAQVRLAGVQLQRNGVPAVTARSGSGSFNSTTGGLVTEQSTGLVVA